MTIESPWPCGCPFKLGVVAALGPVAVRSDLFLSDGVALCVYQAIDTLMPRISLPEVRLFFH